MSVPKGYIELCWHLAPCRISLVLCSWCRICLNETLAALYLPLTTTLQVRLTLLCLKTSGEAQYLIFPVAKHSFWLMFGGLVVFRSIAGYNFTAAGGITIPNFMYLCQWRCHGLFLRKWDRKKSATYLIWKKCTPAFVGRLGDTYVLCCYHLELIFVWDQCRLMYCVVRCCLLRCLTTVVFNIPSLKGTIDCQCVLLFGVHKFGVKWKHG